MYSSFDVALKFLELAKKESKFLDPMKLLKMVYIAHGYYLAYFDKPLIKDSIQAWKYGPVIPTLYHTIKRYPSSSYVEYDFIEIYSNNDIKGKDLEYLESFWNHYKDFTGLQLSDLTHQDGTPWKEVYKDDELNVEIMDDLIKSHYKKKINA